MSKLLDGVTEEELDLRFATVDKLRALLVKRHMLLIDIIWETHAILQNFKQELRELAEHKEGDSDDN